MERLWTPWRMAYIKGAERHSSCIFCDCAAGPQAGDETNLLLARGPLAFVILNRFPYNPGHLMVAPLRHVGEIESLTPEELGQMASWAQRCVEALKSSMAPHGFNAGLNQGRVAGAGIVDHVHLHVVPRWDGDTNFMTTVGETKVLPEALEETYAKLKPHF